jgi:hypothetical protein
MSGCWWYLRYGMVLWFLLLFLAPGTAVSIHVPQDAPTLQDAIYHAKPGDTVFVHGGLYRERVIIDRSLEIVGVTQRTDGESLSPPAMGINTGLSVLKGKPPAYAVIASLNGTAIEIRADGVRITDLVLLSDDTCIAIGDHQNIRIQGSLFGECGTGILGVGGRNITMVGNRFEHSRTTGIHLRYTSGVTIQENQFEGGLSGIRGEDNRMWSMGENVFRDLTVAVSATSISDSSFQRDQFDNCVSGYQFFSSRNNIIANSTFHNLTQYLLLSDSLLNDVTIEQGNEAGLFSRDLSSRSQYFTEWFTLEGQNFAFALMPPEKMSGFRQFGEQVRIVLLSEEGGGHVILESEVNLQQWEDIDPFSFGIYQMREGEPVFTGTTYVSGSTIQTRAEIVEGGTYSLLAKKKTPFGLTIEGITLVFLVIAGLVALLLYRRNRASQKRPQAKEITRR